MKAIAWKAQHRLHARYRRLLGRGKCQQQVVTAVGRELLGFIWAIGVAVEREQRQRHLDRGVADPKRADSAQQQRWRPRGTRKGESSIAPMR